MEIEKLKDKLKNRDRVISVLSKDNKFRASIINNTNAAKTAQSKHGLPEDAAILLSRQLASASLLAVYLKGEERIILEASGSGLISKVYAEALQVGEVRGYVNYENDLIYSSHEPGENLIGDGLYKVTKILYAKSEPITGVVKLQKGDISSDLTFYLFQSEQIPSAVILDTATDESGNISASSGLIVQSMPGTKIHELERIYDSISSIKSINELISESKGMENSLDKVMPFEFTVMKRDSVDFFCRCSKDSFKDKLVTLELKELKNMMELNHNELICKFCNAHYYLDHGDFEEMITQVQAKQN